MERDCAKGGAGQSDKCNSVSNEDIEKKSPVCSVGGSWLLLLLDECSLNGTRPNLIIIMVMMIIKAASCLTA